MELTDVPDFLALSREGSLTRAARRLGVNQSTLSRRLAQLEERTGRLFDRTPEGLRATALAERLLPFAEGVEAAGTALAHAQARPTLVEGTVRVAIAEAVSVYLVLPRLAALRALHPALRLEFVVGEGLADLARGEADLAVRHVPSSRGDLVTRLAGRTHYGVMAATSLASTLGTGPTAWPWIGLPARFGHLPELRWYRRYIGVPPVLESNGFLLRIEAVRAGLGVALASRSLRRAPGIVELTTGLPDCEPGPIWLVTHRELRDVPRIAAVWDFLLDALADG